MMFICLTTSDINLNQLGKVVSTRFFPLKSYYFLQIFFEIIKYFMGRYFEAADVHQ